MEVEGGNQAMDKETNQSWSLSFGGRSITTLLSFCMYTFVYEQKQICSSLRSKLLSMSISLHGKQKRTPTYACNDWAFLEKLLWTSSYLDRSLYSHRLEKCETEKNARFEEGADSSFVPTIWVEILFRASCCLSRARKSKVSMSGWLLCSWEVS